jgi:hypothetical protein
MGTYGYYQKKWYRLKRKFIFFRTDKSGIVPEVKLRTIELERKCLDKEAAEG